MTAVRCGSIAYGERVCSQSIVQTRRRSVYGTTVAELGGTFAETGSMPGHQPNQFVGRSRFTTPLAAMSRRSSIATVTPTIGVAPVFAEWIEPGAHDQWLPDGPRKAADCSQGLATSRSAPGSLRGEVVREPLARKRRADRSADARIAPPMRLAFFSPREYERSFLEAAAHALTAVRSTLVTKSPTRVPGGRAATIRR